jgi:cellulose synthase/poly-beta-1,6-N-acetylglucosamine synthase-like glycosyltransferase
MNKAFAVGKYEYVTSYISDKNLKTRYVPSFAAICIYNSNMFADRPRGILGIPPRIRGRGTLFSNTLLRDGFIWKTLLEDSESRTTMVLEGRRGTYCSAAELFDEMPHQFGVLCRQHMRWARGQYQVFCKDFCKLFLGIIYPRRWFKTNRPKPPKPYNPEVVTSKTKRAGITAWDGLVKRFACYDQMFLIFPKPLVTLVFGFIFPVSVAIAGAIMGNTGQLLVALWLVLGYYGALYAGQVALYCLAIVRESGRIRSNPKQLLKFLFVWPFLLIFIQFLNIYALFAPVKWKPIPHIQGNEIESMDIETLQDRVLKK